MGVTRKYKAFTSSGFGGEIGGALGALQSFGGKPANHHDTPLNLDDYVTRKTLDGLFTVIGEEEQSIRDNPAARGTELLKKVFGG